MMGKSKWVQSEKTSRAPREWAHQGTKVKQKKKVNGRPTLEEGGAANIRWSCESLAADYGQA
jgi:hypothetical protein